MQDDKQKVDKINSGLPDKKRRELVAKLAKVTVAAPLATVLVDVSTKVAHAY